jgi:hypothetical protein
LGAFFAGQSAEAEVATSAAFAPYPHTVIPSGSDGFEQSFSIDGGNTNFSLVVYPPLSTHPATKFPSQEVNLVGATNNLGAFLGQALTPTYDVPDGQGNTNNAYIIAFLGGSTINASIASVPWYQPRMALSYNYGPEPWVNIVQNRFASSGALAFQFTGSTDGQTHFGYMDLQVNFSKSSEPAPWAVESLVIGDIKYETTPNTGITIPITVKVTNISIQGGAVSIDFISNHNADPSSFRLLTSPTLGPSAVWTPDEGASFSQVAEAQPPRGMNQATYHVDVVLSGGTSQFFRIRHQ